MSSGHLASPVGEKLDIRKYLLVLNRRKWWGIFPFLGLGLVFTVICLAVPPKYQATCVIKASRSEVAEIYGAGETSKTRTSEAVVSEEIRRFERVMAALADTDIMKDVEERAGGDAARRARLQEILYKRIYDNMAISSTSGVHITVSYLGDNPDDAFTVLSRLVTYFVENALNKERDDARRAKDMAATELTRAKDEQDTLENRYATFREDHPSIAIAGEVRQSETLGDVTRDLEQLDREIAGKRRKLDRYAEQLENMPMQTVKSRKVLPNADVTVYRTRLADLRGQLASALKQLTPAHPAVKTLQKDIQAAEELLAQAEAQRTEEDVELEQNKVRQEYEGKKLELEADVAYEMETRRNLQLRKSKLEEEVHSLPGLQKELTGIGRDRSATAERYDAALKNYKRIDRDYSIKTEGLVSFSVISPARKPQEKNIRHILRLALMGLFVSLAAGVGAIAGTEFLDQSFSDIESARDTLRLPSLGVIPYIETAGDRRTRWLKYGIIFSAIIIVIAALILAVWKVQVVNGAAQNLWNTIKDLCKNLA